MTDDIVTRLREEIDNSVVPDRQVLRDALAEIERLRAAGDEVTRVLAQTPCECPAKCRCGLDSAIHAWQEARRG